MENTKVRLLGLAVLALSASGIASAQDFLAQIKLPPGFSIDVYSADTPNARSLALGEDGTVYVGTMQAGKVYALRDDDADGRADRSLVVASGLTMPNGVAVLDGDLYVADLSRLLRFKAMGGHLADPPAPEVIYSDFPKDVHHGWKYLRVGPDRKFYVGVGAPCNVCLPTDPVYASIVRIDPATQAREIVAQGVRNSVGFDWHPQSGVLWFNDNGRDWLGDDLPPDELNRAPRAGLHFGFPYCHAQGIADPEFGKNVSCEDYVEAAWTFPAHTAPLGMRFYTGRQFPADYQGRLFVAQHGSWNRSQPQGYRVVSVRFKDGEPLGDEVFAEGWLRPDGTATGRPVDVLQMPDGALLVSDDRTGAVYRITYGGRSNP
jgi:glucose/arabinose dehydrogenase